MMDEPTSTEPTTRESEAAPGSGHTLGFLVAFYTLAVMWGIRQVYYWEPSPLDFLVSVALTIALGWWAIVDAKRRQRPIPLLARPWYVLAAGVLVPVYVLSSRRWRGLGWLALHAVGWYVLATVVMSVGDRIVFGPE